MLLLARAHDDLVRRELAGFGDGTPDRALFLGADVGTLTQLLQMDADHRPCVVQRLPRIAVNLDYTFL